MKRLAPWNDPDVRWVCEQHPNKEWPHKQRKWLMFSEECAGPGMVEDTPENRTKGYINS